MVPKTEPYTWTSDEQRELDKILGLDNSACLADLAWIVKRERRFAAILEYRETENGQAEHDRIVDVKRRLQTAAVALDHAVEALSGLDEFWRLRLHAVLGLRKRYLEQLTATRDRVKACATPSGPRRPRHRMKGWGRLIAEAVADVLVSHKIRLTSGPTGTFASVLGVVIKAVSPDRGLLDPEVEGLVKAITKSRRHA